MYQSTLEQRSIMTRSTIAKWILSCFALAAVLIGPGLTVVSAQDTAAPAPTGSDEVKSAQDVEPPTPAIQTGETVADQQALIEKLERYLTGSKFIGQFTIDGNEDGLLTPEEYTIQKAVRPDDGDAWVLTVGIKYSDNDIEMELPPLEIKWADGTPVITVDQMTIPGLGTFDARVLIRKNKYAGTWSHNDVGGHLYGRIEKMDETGEQPMNETGADDEQAEPKAITIQHILIGFKNGTIPGVERSKEEAAALVDTLMAEIADGADFDKLVKQHTDDSHPGIYHMVNTGEQGDMTSKDQSEWVFKRDEMVAAFGNAGFILDIGEVGVAQYDDAASPYGWHIVKRLK